MSELIVGLTGGIGSGKTTIANEFAKLGAGLVDADIVAREVVAKGTPALTDIASRFGPDILTETGELNRDKLRQQVFANEQQRLWLNNLLHPLIRQQMIEQSRAQSSPYTILVIPLLVENNLQALCQRVVCVDVPVSIQIQRTCQRDGVSAPDAQAIIARQASRWQRMRVADDIIRNDRSLQLVTKDVLQLHQLYLEFATHHTSS